MNADWIDTEEGQQGPTDEIEIRKRYIEDIIAPTKLRREFYEESPIVFKQAVNIKGMAEWI